MMSEPFRRLHAWSVAEHEWGYFDCMMTLADWVNDCMGIDPGADLRGTYGNPEVCAIGRKYRRDPELICRKAFAGLDVTDAPKVGDIGLVRFKGQRWPVGALCMGQEWGSKSEGRGVLVERPVAVVVAWSVHCEA